MTPNEAGAACGRKALLDIATRIEFADGHLIQKSGEWWYAFPKLDTGAGVGGAVLTETGPAPMHGPFAPSLKFETAVDARIACEDAVTRWGGTGIAAGF